MSNICCIYAVYPGMEAAKASARLVVEERLAACANIFSPCASIYEWEGQLREEREVPVLFKTSPAQRDALIERLAELHSYEVPAIVAWNSNAAHSPFENWVQTQVK